MNASTSLAPITFNPGQLYRRRDLHARFGGQQQGGICTPSNYPLILIFTGETGASFGYYDGWDDGIFKYTGEGQVGDMTFVRGNRAIRDHLKDGKDLHLFRCGAPGIIQYVGQMVCVGHSWSKTPDIHRQQRNSIIFHLQSLGLESFEPNKENKVLSFDMPLKTLRSNAMQVSQPESEKKLQLVSVRIRSEAIKLYALKRAEGKCESCRHAAPFKTRTGEPFLECHHLRRLSDGGPDDPNWVAGICPNCHRHIHYGVDGTELNSRLITTIQNKEAQFHWQN